MKVVLDTNVIVSGFLSSQSPPQIILEAWRNNAFEMLLCDAMLEELALTFHYPKIKKRIGWKKDAIDLFVLFIRLKAIHVDISKQEGKVPRDTNDDMILRTYLAGEADYLVTGDKDLLVLQDRYNILTPRQFLSLL